MAETKAIETKNEKNDPMTDFSLDDYKTYLKVFDKKIGSIEFSLLSPETIRKMSAVKVVTHELYDSEGYPVDGGLMDTRMGVIDPGLRCRTCGGTIKECTGHFGHIELARPVIHVKFVNLIYELLKTTCSVCGMPLIPKEELDHYLKEIKKANQNMTKVELKEFINKIKSKIKWHQTCPHCHAKQKKIILEKPYNFYEEDRRLTPTEIKTRLERIPDDVLPLFGLDPGHARPEWAILTVLPVPPVTMRPSITLDTGERSEDDLTHKLSDIVRFNQRLFENINAGAPEVIIEDLWDLLQYHVATFFDNSIAQLPVARHRSGQPLKSLVERIKGKEGRMRHNLAGKRVNFSARSVISPDPRIAFDEVGVPIEVAKVLTVPIRVTTWNIEYAKQFVKNAENYPGANYVIRPDGTIKKVTSETKEMLLEEIKPGYIVERHLMDGDIVLFNRYPSLHRLSIMAHKVKVLPGKTFRLNPAVCPPYNADFDGDEMNIHVPQTAEAQAEARELLYVPYNMISPKNGLAIVGPSLDAVVGNYILSRFLKLDRKEAIELLGSVGVYNFKRLPKKEILDGKELYACVLPEGFEFSGPTKAYKPGQEKSDNNWLIIKDGKIVQGYLDSKTLGGVMIRKMHKQFGQQKTIEVLYKLSLLGIRVATRFGFSTGISHYDLEEEINKKIEEILDKAYNNVDKLLEAYYNETLELIPGRTKDEALELKILEVLNKARNAIGDLILKESKKQNDSLIMMQSGAKGNIINIAQIAGTVGQQSLKGKRIEFGYKHRVLPHFKPHDLKPDARGFIKSSFRKGMKPLEFFFQAITGRDSLINKGMATPKSGYLYRRMANALQDLVVDYDLTVKDGSKTIVQFEFGEDGMEVGKTEGGDLNVERIINEVLAE